MLVCGIDIKDEAKKQPRADASSRATPVQRTFKWMDVKKIPHKITALEGMRYSKHSREECTISKYVRLVDESGTAAVQTKDTISTSFEQSEQQRVGSEKCADGCIVHT